MEEKRWRGEVGKEQKATLPMERMDRNETSNFRYKFAHYMDYVQEYLCWC